MPERLAMSHADALLTVQSAADETGLSVRFVRHLFSTRQLPVIKLGARRLFVRRGDLLAFIAAGSLVEDNDK